MNVSFEEIGHLSATFAAAGAVAGQVCKLSENGTVAACEAGEKFCGVIEGIRGGYAGVQMKGFVEVSWSGEGMNTGYVNLTADGSGGVKSDENGREYLVVSVDENGKTAVIDL